MATGTPFGHDQRLLDTSCRATPIEGKPEAGAHTAGVSVDSLSPTVAVNGMTREDFSVVFDHCFDRVFAYVARRVEDRAACERIVREVLSTHLHFLVDGGDEKRMARALKASSDVRIEEAKASRLSALSVSSPQQG